MPGKTLNVGLVGYQFMGKAHSNAWLNAPHFFDLPRHPVLHSICGRDRARLQVTADRWGWQNAVTDYHDLVQDPEIDLVDVAVPNNVHPEVVLAAAEQGKAIACEKPLARTLPEARAMAAAVKKAKVPSFVWFNYRRVPALAFARQLIQAGRIGKVYHIRCLYLQDWIKDAALPLVWRVDKKVAGSGSLGDLAAHSIDMVRFLLGDEFSEVSGLLHTFVKQRPIAGRMKEGLLTETTAGPKRMGRVEVDDAVLFIARLKSGAIGTIEATRFATGHNNGNMIEINGEKGSIRYSLPEFNFLEFFDDTLPRSERGWRRISATLGQDPYSGNYWFADHPMGYGDTFINMVADICTAMAGKSKEFHADFEDGVRCQEVLEAVTVSAREKRWVNVNEV